MHIVDGHMDLLHKGTETHKQCKTMTYDSDAVIALSVYNESLAIAIRRGAPFASYSIDRTCLRAYATHLTHSDTATLICFSCARKFPCVHGATINPIQTYNIKYFKTSTKYNNVFIYWFVQR